MQKSESGLQQFGSFAFTFFLALVSKVGYPKKQQKGCESMTKEQYEKWSSSYRMHPGRIRLLAGAGRAASCFVAISYLSLLLYLLWDGSFVKLAQCVFVPAISFLLVSLFRRCYNAPRPYETPGIQPLIPKETKGKSFPSRHVFSAFVIGMTYFGVCRPLGLVLCAMGALLSYIRVVSGIHHPLDVAAGALLGILCGLPLFIL